MLLMLQPVLQVGHIIIHVCTMLCILCTLFMFVVPFDEDDRDPNVWFLDHNYLENMVAMFKKVNCM